MFIVFFLRITKTFYVHYIIMAINDNTGVTIYTFSFKHPEKKDWYIILQKLSRAGKQQKQKI